MSAEDYHDNVYSSYRPTSASLRSDAGNVPPGRFREEVTRGSTQDAYAETDPITAYPLGTTTATVSAAADWNSLGHSGTVETQRSDGGGSQTLTDDEDGSVYRRYWADDDWSEWVAVGVGGPIPSQVLDPDEFAENDPLTDYPDGITAMDILDGWNGQGTSGFVLTDNSGSGGKQTAIYADGDNAWEEIRYWTGADWTAWDEGLLYSTAVQFFARVVDADFFAEADVVGTYPPNLTYFTVASGNNWGPNTGEAGSVLTRANGDAFSAPSAATQEFVQFSDAALYKRYWTGSAWSAWA